MFTETVTRICTATGYFDLFGAAPGTMPVERHLKSVYHQLARQVHPDLHPSCDEQGDAKAALQRLGELYQQALIAVERGVYGQVTTLATIKSRTAQHEISAVLASGDLASLYLATTTKNGSGQDTVLKLARTPADNDLMKAEAAAFKQLRAGGDPKLHEFFPELIDSFGYGARGAGMRQANVLTRLDGFYNLHQVLQVGPSGVNPLAMVWMWRRLLYALGHAHQQGVIHGAVIPEHVMLLPEKHGIVVIDWCYSSLAVDGVFPPLTALVERYRDWYPPEVLAKNPPSAATDIMMAARTMIYLLGGDAVSGTMPNTVPRMLRAFLKGCLSPRQAARPDDAWLLLSEFDELLREMGRPYYPRKFVPFYMPRGV